MKIFNVIAILCSIFIVVNGQTTQQHRFTLTIPSDVNVNGVNVTLGFISHPMVYENGKYTFNITSDSIEYYYSYIEDGVRVNENLFEIQHPCLYTLNDDITYRSVQGLEHEDTLLEPPSCDLGTVQCDEFIYDRDFFNGNYYDICKSIPVNEISTLKSALAESSLFNGNCEIQ